MVGLPETNSIFRPCLNIYTDFNVYQNLYQLDAYIEPVYHLIQALIVKSGFIMVISECLNGDKVRTFLSNIRAPS